MLGFNDELREKVSVDVGPMKELINVKDSGVNELINVVHMMMIILMMMMSVYCHPSIY